MQDKRNTESVVQEIIGLVDDIIGCDSAGYQFECKREIQSKLHELVERCSVREPLSDDEIEKATGTKHGTPTFLVATGFVRATERAHNITNTTKE